MTDLHTCGTTRANPARVHPPTASQRQPSVGECVTDGHDGPRSPWRAPPGRAEAKAIVDRRDGPPATYFEDRGWFQTRLGPSSTMPSPVVQGRQPADALATHPERAVSCTPGGSQIGSPREGIAEVRAGGEGGGEPSRRRRGRTSTARPAGGRAEAGRAGGSTRPAWPGRRIEYNDRVRDRPFSAGWGYAVAEGGCRRDGVSSGSGPCRRAWPRSSSGRSSSTRLARGDAADHAACHRRHRVCALEGEIARCLHENLAVADVGDHARDVAGVNLTLEQVSHVGQPFRRKPRARTRRGWCGSSALSR
jgi:hypothetical protein